jgi:holo-[acyl-carrier protein] synthase
MILGIGTDLVEVARMAQAIARGERLVRRLFTDQEIAYCNRHKEPARHFAARFAAKEAGMKALGTGWSNGVAWKDFEVRLDPRGRPHLFINGRAAEIAHAMGATHAVISLAHDGGFALAMVAIDGDPTHAAAFGPGVAPVTSLEGAWPSGRTAIGQSPPPGPADPAPPGPDPGQEGGDA